MKNYLKKIARRSGLYKLSSLINNNVLSVLMYHGFCQFPKKLRYFHRTGMILNINIFEQQLESILKYSTPISLKMAVTSNELPPNAVAFTFDDGYKNNYLDAFPLLKKHNIPTTIFITTGFIDKKCYLWADRLDYILNEAEDWVYKLISKDGAIEIDLSNNSARRVTITKLKNYIKKLPDRKKNQLIDMIEAELGISYSWDVIPDELKPLSWDEIREMHQSGLVTFGAHTVTHPILRNCDYKMQEFEINYARKRIEEELDAECIYFAYPNGKTPDYSHLTIELLEKAGYKAAVTANSGYVDNINGNLFELNRFGSAENIDDLATVISGFSKLIGSGKGN